MYYSLTNFEYEAMNVNADQVILLFNCKNSWNHIKCSANLFLAGFSNSELTVSRPGEKAVLAQDGWQYSLGRIEAASAQHWAPSHTAREELGETPRSDVPPHPQEPQKWNDKSKQISDLICRDLNFDVKNYIRERNFFFFFNWLLRSVDVR